MARITIHTLVPANTEISDARRSARMSAAEQLNLHIVEESCPPVNDKIPGPDGAMIDSPSDHSVDRTLITVWDYLEGKTSGQ